MTTTDLPEWARNIAVFDTETTGVTAGTDRIVTATVAILNEHGAVEERASWLLNPDFPIDPKATEVHGVSDARAKSEGSDAATGVREILESVLASGLPVVAFNAVFDFSILRAECERYGIDFKLPSLIVDPHVIDKHFDKYRKGKRTLTATTEAYGVPFENAHDAEADAVAAGRLLQAMVRRLGLSVTDNLMRAQTSWKREQAINFQGYLRMKGNADAYINPGWPLEDRVVAP